MDIIYAACGKFSDIVAMPQMKELCEMRNSLIADSESQFGKEGELDYWEAKEVVVAFAKRAPVVTNILRQ